MCVCVCVSCADAEPTCHFCKRISLPQFQAMLPEGDVLSFCSSQCVTKFQVSPGSRFWVGGLKSRHWLRDLIGSTLPLQNAAVETVTNGQAPVGTATNSIQLKCNYCRGAFSLKPEILEWEVSDLHAHTPST